MKEITRKFLNLFFDIGESICVSPDQFAYHSVSQDVLDGPINLISPNEKVSTEIAYENNINLIAINPIDGYREDKNVTTYRSFLVELDDLDLAQQRAYVSQKGMPYSVCIFSGNKSLHYGIVLETPFPDEYNWRMTCKWILNIMDQADQVAKNPSRCIRFPDNIRNDGRQLQQVLVELKNRVPNDELSIWLHKFPECKPQVRKRRSRLDRPMFISGLPKKVKELIDGGITDNRNDTWFYIACECVRAGKDEDQIIDELQDYFDEDFDFKENEWRNVIKNAIKQEDK